MNRSLSELNLIVRSLEMRVAELEGSTVKCTSAICCEHANEMPYQCPCDDDCYCKQHSCKER